MKVLLRCLDGTERFYDAPVEAREIRLAEFDRPVNWTFADWSGEPAGPVCRERVFVRQPYKLARLPVFSEQPQGK